MHTWRLFLIVLSAPVLCGGNELAFGDIQTWVIGEEAKEWGSWGTFEAMRDSAGWIQPEEVDPRSSILRQRYQEGKLKVGTPLDYAAPRDHALIWSPFITSANVQAQQSLLRLADGTGVVLEEGTSIQLLGGVMIRAADVGDVRLPNGTEVILSDRRVVELHPDTQLKNVQVELLNPTAAMRDTTAFDFFNREKNKGVAIYVDLGWPFPLSRIRFFPLGLGNLGDLYMKGFEIYVNDGRPESLDDKHFPIFTLLPDWKVPKNKKAIVDLELPEPRYVRHIKLQATAADPFVLDQLELYGKGFAREAIYTSKLIDFGGIANLGKIHWVDVKKPATSVNVQTRVGTDNTLMVYNEINDVGDEVPIDRGTDEANKTAWEALSEARRGTVHEDTEHWSSWSRPYALPGQEIAARGPRRYLQFRIALTNEVALNKAQVALLSIQFSRPALASELWGKISPRKHVDLGASSRFRYTIYPTIRGEDIGFDTVEIGTPTAASLDSVRIAGELLLKAAYTVLEEENLLKVSFPDHRITQSDSLDLVFLCKTLEFKTAFEGRVSASWLAGASLPQRIEERTSGDVTVQGAEESLGTILSDVEISPNPMTPNHDGVNDDTHISFTLMQIVGEVPVTVTLCPLSGKSVWSHRALLPVGRHSILWDGKDTEDTLVPPGVYMVRIRVAGDEKAFMKVGTVVVVY